MHTHQTAQKIGSADFFFFLGRTIPTQFEIEAKKKKKKKKNAVIEKDLMITNKKK